MNDEYYVKVGDIVQGEFQTKYLGSDSAMRRTSPIGKVTKITDKYIYVTYYDQSQEDPEWGCAKEFVVGHHIDNQDFSHTKEVKQSIRTTIDWYTRNNWFEVPYTLKNGRIPYQGNSFRPIEPITYIK
tara:strand:- start:183 stop:566 length:384 start_codon:yes stop_codon:yes gene_type:complete